MSVRVDLQSISAGYFIDRRDALGVMTGQYTLLEYQTAGFSPGCEGFLLEQCLGLPIQGSSVDFAPRGVCSRVFGSRQFPDAFKEKTRFTDANVEKIITEQAQNSKVLYLLPMFKHP
jgi:hypothetical protein